MTRVRRLVNHDMTFGYGLGNIAVSSEAVAQKVKTRLYTLRGEWFLDLDAGVPYLQRITVKPSNLPYAESVIKQTILTTDGVEELNAWQMQLDHDTRKLNISCRVSTIYGTTENITVGI